MAGLRKAKKYDWKDSNMALFGSDTDRQVKKESAESEPAWEGAGGEVGLKIWRIQKFEVTDWPKEDYGKFYNGDSYIVLNTYKKDDSDEFLYDLHFWIGKHSTQDEYGTAAYKTVELDTFLDDKAVQHREVQDHESDKFKSYFKTLELLKGGAESGFRHVEPKEYVPRLLRIRRTKQNTTVSQCPFSKKALNSDDVFIVDNGLELLQLNGANSDGFERNKAASYCQSLEGERGKCQTTVFEEGEWGRADELLPDEGTEDDDDDEDESVEVGDMELFKISDEDGSLDMEHVKTGPVTMGDLGSDDVYLVDTGMHIFVYVGSQASPNEKKNGIAYATKYVNEKDKPWAPFSVVGEGRSSEMENMIG